MLLSACGPAANRYMLVDNHLRAREYKQADAVIQRAEEDYGAKNRVLYGMDRGMTLHLAGDYQQSNAVLEQADERIERLYTRSIRSESAAFMTNDYALPYEGDPYEQVMVNVVKALNYAAMDQWQDALVEARRIDHRLNVIADKTQDKGAYRDDGFVRYLCGILYESAGDINNAFIAYRKAYETYQSTRGWSGMGVPGQLRVDLLRTADALHLTQELADYQSAFPESTWQTLQSQQHLAQVLVISYNGRAPHKEDQFLDLPLNMEALQLVLLNRGLSQTNRSLPSHRTVDSVLYGLQGRVVRVALPRLVPQKTRVPVDHVFLINQEGNRIEMSTELAQDVTAMAEKALSERITGITMKALARAAFKYSLAEGATRGAQGAAGKDAAPWVGLLVGLFTKGLAVATEESDKRSWRTLPDEIHLARRWVAPGQYRVKADHLIGGPGTTEPARSERTLSLNAGGTGIIIQRVVQ